MSRRKGGRKPRPPTRAYTPELAAARDAALNFLWSRTNARVTRGASDFTLAALVFAHCNLGRQEPPRSETEAARFLLIAASALASSPKLFPAPTLAVTKPAPPRALPVIALPPPARRPARASRSRVGALVVEGVSVQSSDFLRTRAWRELRYKVLRDQGRVCQCCGTVASTMHVDHIRPRHTHPELALVENNLQVLCEDCNLGKGAWDDTDWRLGGNVVPIRR